MNFADLSKNIIKENTVEEKINWPGLMAAGLMALPGSAKEAPQQREKPAIQQKVQSDINFKGELKKKYFFLIII